MLLFVFTVIASISQNVTYPRVKLRWFPLIIDICILGLSFRRRQKIRTLGLSSIETPRESVYVSSGYVAAAKKPSAGDPKPAGLNSIQRGGRNRQQDQYDAAVSIHTL